MLTKEVKTEKEIDELAESLKQDLKRAKEAGYEGIGVYQLHPGQTMFRSELRFTFQHKEITFSGCLYEPEVIGTILRAILNTVED